MDVISALVADGEAAEAVEPGEGPLDPPPVLAEPLAALDASPGNARDDATASAFMGATAIFAGLAGVQLARPAMGPSSPSSLNAWHSIQDGGQHAAVVAVSAAER
jgi:hypothetical protein